MNVPLTAGVFHTCALTPAGGVMCWGAGGDGALGNGSNIDSHAPVGVTGLSSGVMAVVAGWYHTCALTAGGGVKCWGDNSHGQLGHGTGNSNVPLDVTGLPSGVGSIAAGGFHTCALTTAGGVKCWGDNSHGQLGVIGPTSSDVPLTVTGLSNGVASITAGYYHTCAVTTAGDVKCWGENFSGQLGDGSTANKPVPVDVLGLSGDASDIAAGESHTCALETGGGVECWGDNGYGQLGDGTFESSVAPAGVTGLSSGVAAISSHGIHSCALTTGGGVKCWGNNFKGQLGDGTTGSSGEPVDVTGLQSGVAAIAAGYYHSCALTTAGLVTCWGRNNFGQLGDGSTTESHVPVDVSGTFGPTWIAIDDVNVLEGDVGTNHAAFTVSLSAASANPITVDYATADGSATAGPDYTTASGTLTFASGETAKSITIDVIGDTAVEGDETLLINLSNATNAAIFDASGRATITDDDQPVPLAHTRLDAGGAHACAITGAGVTKCWGYNLHGQVGDGNKPNASPVAVPVTGLSSGVAAVSAGNHHSCALTTGGGVLCWGNGGALDAGSGNFAVDVAAPAPVPGLGSGVASISAGGNHTCAVTTGGAVWCWGQNDEGELGDGTRTDRSTPVAVPSLSSGVVAITTGSGHTCALSEAGAVSCWGSNIYGQLGGGTTAEDSLVPLPVTGLGSGIVAISAGSTFTCALRQDGTVACWGVNFYGQLGDGTHNDSPNPVSVQGLPGPIAAIAAGDHNTCVLTNAGAAWCWGDNSHGQLGNGSLDLTSTIPVPVSGLQSGGSEISVGGDFACALSAGPFVRCWGANGGHQLGDRTDFDHYTPVGVVHYGSDASIGDVALAEGDSGTTPATLTISLSEPSTETVSVGWATLGVDALAGEDYEGSGGTVTFAPGDTSEQVSIDVFGDTTHEADEAFTVQIGPAVNAAIDRGEATATITNDDLAVRPAAIDSGYGHTCAVTSTGGVKCWGNSLAGQLGFGGGSYRLGSVVDVINLEGPVGAVSAGTDHTCAVTMAGGVQCWGSNGSGQLGNGTTAYSSPSPVDVTNLSTGAVSVSAGDAHTCAVTSAGGVLCWGRNDHGQLGNTGGDSTVPVAVAGLSGVQMVAAGLGHTCALTTAGGVVCWGFNNVGQLGNGATGAGGPTPVAVSGLSSGVVAITTSTSHTCALLTGGGIKCWGYNHYGQLGDDSLDEFHSTPVGVTGFGSGAIAVAAGWNHTCAVASGGAVWCWGTNGSGQVGNATPDDYRTPQLVAGLSSGAVDVAAGDHSSCALMDELIKCWGSGGLGELGVCLPGGFLFCPSSSSPVNVIGWGPDIVIHDATFAEGNAGGTLKTFEVTLAKPSAHEIRVDYATADRTATAGSDYTATSGTLTFAPGDTSEDITVEVFGDMQFEPDEQFDVLLSNPVFGPLAWGVGVGTIQNDDAAVTVTIDDLEVLEGNTGLTPATFTISVSEPSTQTVTVDWFTQGISAFADGDYHAASGTATFAPGDTSETITIDVVGDSDNEGDEQFSVRLGAASNASIADDTGIATILDDDAATISVGDASVAEGNTGTARATFTVSLSEPSPSTITVDFSTFDNDAIHGVDFGAASGVVTFLPGDVDEPITIDVYGDTAIEADETFYVALQNSIGASIVDGLGIGTIVNDDVPAITIGDVTVPEGTGGTPQAALTVQLSAASTVPVTVHYATADSSATSPADFAAASGTLTFNPGETTREIRIDLVGDALDETNETFAVDLSNATNATIADTFAIVTISDDDAPPGLCVNDASAVEGDSGTTPLVFTICLSAPSGRDVSVSFATSNGTAVAGGDYTATSGSATILAGATTATVTVPVRGDLTDEVNETFTLNLSSPVNATIADPTGVGTIVDDDPKPVITSFNPTALPQGDTVTIRGSGFTGATQVAFARAGGGTVNATAFHVVNDGRLTATVPPTATTGRVSVTTAAGTGTSPTNLLIQPRIAGFSPAAGPVGTVVTITGTGFTGATAVRFGTTPATFTVVSDTQVRATVPAGARTGKITVVTAGGQDVSMNKFTVQ